MNKRRWCLLIGSVALGLLVVAGFWVYQARDHGPIRYENFDKIQDGMSMTDVEKLLGCSPGNHATGPIQGKFVANDGESFYFSMEFSRADSPAKRGGTIFVWHGDRGEISVDFDRENTVVDKHFRKGRRVPSSWWLALERWWPAD